MEAVYLALAAEASGGGEGKDGTSSSPLPRSKPSGNKRARVGDAGVAVSRPGEDDGEEDGDDAGSDAGDNSSTASSGVTAPAKARSLLHATISRYFDEGGNNHSGKDGGGRGPPGADGCGSSGGSAASMAVEGEKAAAATRGPTRVAAGAGAAMEEDGEEDEEGKAKKERAEALPHQPLDKRACEVLVRDASVLVTDPSFQGRLDTGFDDGFGGGGGLGFFDVATGTTSAAGGGGGTGVRGMAPHSWLLKVREGLVLWGVETPLVEVYWPCSFARLFRAC